jgi:hypothetical protein
MDMMNDDRNTGVASGQPAEDAGFAAVGVHDLGPLAAKQFP